MNTEQEGIVQATGLAPAYAPRTHHVRRSPGGLRVLVVIPAYNEGERIESVVADVRQEVPWADLVVVDDGSDDGTSGRAARLGVEVLKLPFNLGVGGAMQTGYLYARERGYDATIQFDGDGQHRADQVALLVTEIETGADLVVGSRLLGRVSYRFSITRWLGSRLLGSFVRLVTGNRVTDPTSGFRAASRRMTAFFARYYPQTYLGDTVEALVVASRHGMKIREIPTRMRMTRRSSIGDIKGIFHTVRICLAILIDGLERKFPFAPDESSNREPSR